jgi:hypothetical protein
MSVRKPNFFVVGAPKCGTTAMQAYLERHPNVYMPRVKESHHFATDLLASHDPYRSVDKYMSMFRDARTEKIVGESSVFYLYSKKAAENIREFNEDSKILAMVRNPVEWLESYHSQLVFNGDENILDLGRALEAEQERKRGNLIPENLRFAERLFYSEVLRFSEQIQRFFDTFGRDRVHVIVYDDLKKDTLRTYQKILKFLAVAPHFYEDFEVVNANKRVRSRILQSFTNHPPPWVRAGGRALMPRSLRVALKGRLKRFNTKFEARSAMDPELRRHLQGRFSGEVQQLSTLLGRDLTGWSEG